MATDRYDDLIALRQATLANQRELLVQEAELAASEIQAQNENAREYLKQGDTENAQLTMQRIMELEQQLQERYLQLGPQEENPLSPAKQAWIAQRQDLAANPVIVQGAAYFHDYITKTMGVPDDSPQYFELMSMVVEPQNYQPMMTPNEAAKISGLDAKTYNNGVRRFLSEKAAGSHRDK
jgi:hypothetical protein